MKEAVFLLGSPRSVTSWRCHALNYSPDIFMYHECNLFGMHGNGETCLNESRGAYLDQLANKIIRNPFPDHKDLDIDISLDNYMQVRKFLERKCPIPDGDFTAENILNLIENISFGFDVVGDKLPNYIENGIDIAGQYENAKFLLTMRNPLYISQSMYVPDAEITEWWQTPDLSTAIDRATKYLALCKEFVEKVPDERFLVWRVENLRDNPEKNWGRVLNFIGAKKGNIIKHYEDSFYYKHYDVSYDDLADVDGVSVKGLRELAEYFGYDA